MTHKTNYQYCRVDSHRDIILAVSEKTGYSERIVRNIIGTYLMIVKRVLRKGLSFEFPNILKVKAIKRNARVSGIKNSVELNRKRNNSISRIIQKGGKVVRLQSEILAETNREMKVVTDKNLIMKLETDYIERKIDFKNVD